MNKRIISERTEQEILKSPENKQIEDSRFAGVLSGLLGLEISRQCIMYFANGDKAKSPVTNDILIDSAFFVASIGIAKAYAKFRTLREFHDQYIVMRPIKEHRQTTAEWCEKAFARREFVADDFVEIDEYTLGDENAVLPFENHNLMPDNTQLTN